MPETALTNCLECKHSYKWWQGEEIGNDLECGHPAIVGPYAGKPIALEAIRRYVSPPDWCPLAGTEEVQEGISR
jgi:hypothetical protein